MTAFRRDVHFELNGKAVSAIVDTCHNLVDLLQMFDLHGARESCGQGLCGCCTAVVDGEVVSGCLFPAVLVNGKSVNTIEGLDANGRLTIVQEAFIAEGAFQCGFCTPGFVLTAEKLLQMNPDPSDDDIRDYMAGNLCRCAAYPEIIRAVKAAAKRKREDNSGNFDAASDGVVNGFVRAN